MNLTLSISCRIAEGFLSKEEARMSLDQLAQLAVAADYQAICMRGSQIGVHSSDAEIASARQLLDQYGLRVSMVTGDFDIVYNNNQGPSCLRDIEPHLDLAAALGAPMIRVCLKEEADLPYAQQAADRAQKRGLLLVHQCHIQSLFETLDQIEARLMQIDHPHFGLIFEAANLQQCGQDYGPEAIQRLAPWIKNVYLQNQRLHSQGGITLDTWSRGPVTLDVCEIPEAGSIDFARIFAGLRASGYDGPVTVHQSAPEDASLSALDAARQTAGFLRQLAS